MRHSLEFVGKGSIHFSPGKVHPHTRPQFRGSLATPPPPRGAIAALRRVPATAPQPCLHLSFPKGLFPVTLRGEPRSKVPRREKAAGAGAQERGPVVLRPQDGAWARLDRREPRDAAKGPGQPRQAPQCPGSKRCRWGRGAVGAARPWAPLGAEPPGPAAEGRAPGGLISVL